MTYLPGLSKWSREQMMQKFHELKDIWLRGERDPNIRGGLTEIYYAMREKYGEDIGADYTHGDPNRLGSW